MRAFGCRAWWLARRRPKPPAMELLSDGGYGDSGEGLPPSYERSFAHSDAAGGITRDEKGGAQPQAYGMIAHDAGGDGDVPSWMDTSVEDMFAAADVFGAPGNSGGLELPAPSALRCTSFGSDSLLLEWAPPPPGGGELLGYTLHRTCVSPPGPLAPVLFCPSASPPTLGSFTHARCVRVFSTQRWASLGADT